MEARLERLYGRLLHRRVLAPLAPRLEDGPIDGPPVRGLAGLLCGEGGQPLDQRLAPRLILPAQLGLPGKVLATGLVGALRRLLELLPLGRGLLPRAAVEGPPLVPQLADAPCEFLGGQIGADQGPHALDQLGPLRHDPEVLPVLQLRESRVDPLELSREPRGQGGCLLQGFRDRRAQSRGTCRPAMIQRRLRLSQQPEKIAHLRLVRCTPLALGLTLGGEHTGLFDRRRGRFLCLQLPLAPLLFDGEGGGSPLLFLCLERLPVPLDDLARMLKVLCNPASKLRGRVRLERAPPGLELRQGGQVRRIAGMLAVPFDGGGGPFHVRLQLCGSAGFGKLLIPPGRENPMDLLVLAVARGADQLAQLVRIDDAAGRRLAGLRRACLEHPLADRGHIASSNRLRQARFLFPGARGAVGRWWCLDSVDTFAGRRCPGRGRWLTKQA